MLIENQHPHNKSISIALLGCPNAGKSSLINTLLGFDLSIVSHKPQTTRNRFQCILTIDRTEVILSDTPGLHEAGSNQELNLRMNGQVKMYLDFADINFILLDLSQNIPVAIQTIMKKLERESLTESWVIFTKSDISDRSEQEIELLFNAIQEKYPFITRYFVISSKTGDNIHELTGAICDAAPAGPHLFPRGEVSNKNERFFAAEYIREQAFELLKEELPYEMAVTIDDFHDVIDPSSKERKMAKISASILVNRPSQRAIVVGRKGSIIKELGIRSRKKIESMAGVKVHLNLHVKVSPKWFKNNFVLEELGLPRVEQSARVWRQ